MLLSSENLIIEKEDLLGKVVFLFGSTKEKKNSIPRVVEILIQNLFLPLSTYQNLST